VVVAAVELKFATVGFGPLTSTVTGSFDGRARCIGEGGRETCYATYDVDEPLVPR
jgi:hypothetical protein